MARRVVLSALLTGAFCAVFAVVVDAVTMLLDVWHLMAISFLSGGLGSLFSSLVLGRRGPLAGKV